MIGSLRNRSRRWMVGFAGLVLALMGVLFVLHRHFGPGRPLADAPPGPRTLRFPDDRSYGNVLVRDWGSRDLWILLGEARGDIAVPAGKEVMFKPHPPATNFWETDQTIWDKVRRRIGRPVTIRVPTGLSALAVLRSDDVQAIAIDFPNAGCTELVLQYKAGNMSFVGMHPAPGTMISRTCDTRALCAPCLSTTRRSPTRPSFTSGS